MGMSNKAISTALSTHLKAMTGLPPVAWENATFTPTNGTLYLRENTLFAGDIPIGIGFGDTVQKVGIYQVTVCAPLNGGKFPAFDMADKVLTHFARGTKLTKESTITLITIGSVAPAMVDGNWFVVPVSINWQSMV
jgi:hypothetical protein